MKYKVDLKFTAEQTVTISIDREGVPANPVYWDIELTAEEIADARKRLSSFFDEDDSEITWIREAK